MPRDPANGQHKPKPIKGTPMTETFYEVMRRQGITRRSYLKFCSLTAASLGLAPAFAPTIAHALETKPRTPVLWLHGLECTCRSESFIRSSHPLAKAVVHATRSQQTSPLSTGRNLYGRARPSL